MANIPPEPMALFTCRPPWAAADRGGEVHVWTELPTPTRRTDAPDVRRDAALLAISALPTPDVTIWSDGSAKGGFANGGAGAVVQLHYSDREVEVRAPAGGVCSSLRAELMAMRESLAVVAGLPEEELQLVSHIRLLTDSRSGLELLRRGAPAQTFALAADVWNLLHALEDLGKRLDLQWVPGHAGLDGNELADRLANEAAVDDQGHVPVDLASARGATGRLIQTWTRRRASEDHPHPAPTPDHDSLTRWEAVTLSQLRTGASPLTRDVLLRLGLAADDVCPACGEPDSAVHLLTDCPAYAAARGRRWGPLPTLGDVLGGPAAKVVGFLREVGRTDFPVDPPAQ